MHHFTYRLTTRIGYEEYIGSHWDGGDAGYKEHRLQWARFECRGFDGLSRLVR